MIRNLNIVLIFFLALLIYSCAEAPKSVLIFSKTAGYRHSSIKEGSIALQKLLSDQGIQVETSENSEIFTKEKLKNFAAIIFLNTTGDILNNEHQIEFERYIQAGGGFVGIHSATDTEYDWQWYNGLVGAQFKDHPAIQLADVQVVKKDDICCRHLPEKWSIKEEWYNFKSISSSVEMLLTVDESSYQGGTNGDNHPISWKQNYDGGRAFYTALGHLEETFLDSLFLIHIGEGIKFAMGSKKLDYSKSISQKMPEENRFTRQVIDFNLDEPMELAELGDRGIIYIERRGAIKLYEYDTEQIVNLDTIEVHYADEDGLIGIAVDPEHEKNNWLYLFYSPDIEEETQYISRFTLQDNKLTNEQIILKIPLTRECCHSGGSLEFGDDGLLYIGVGDNTNPFESAGYAPIDERNGREHFDAQGTAANTNDLRGKILRIKPEPDGSYSIPDGNLFPVGSSKCRPEIYAMGLRNPFRFSIDSKTNYLYWGDVGPDAGTSDSKRGPKGLGEFNQAKEAGFYGWPYSRGNNQMYRDYDFADKSSGPLFEENSIVNNSPNNTGLEKLPPIQQSMIWYGYDKSEEFTWLGKGGVNPMSGPIYHSDNYNASENSFPTFFDNKWFVYEWMRHWIYVVELDENQQYVSSFPFMRSTEFSRPMDMIFANDGTMYLLEYGKKWNSRNLDARLSKVTYITSNRPPVAHFGVDKEAGAAPLTVHFTASESIDYDNDKLTYTWDFGLSQKSTTNPEIDFTFTEPGIYNVQLEVSDTDGAKSITNTKILVGNEPPEITINLNDSSEMYWTGKTVDYNIQVTDLEDGNTVDFSLDPSKIKVTLGYIPEGEDMILAAAGHQQNLVPEGLKLINESGCTSCHAIKEKVAGPSYEDVAAKYDQSHKQQIVRRIIIGSNGVWGQTMMSAHPQLSIEEVGVMVDYILSLDQPKPIEDELLPLSGTIAFTEHSQEQLQLGKYILTASYLDKGNSTIENSSLGALAQVTFSPPKIELENDVELDSGLGLWEAQGRKLVGSLVDGKTLKVEALSFEKLKSFSLGAYFSKNYKYGGTVELRADDLNGELLGTSKIQYFNEDSDGFKIFEIPFTKTNTTAKTIVLVFKNTNDKDQVIMNGDWLQFNYRE